MKASLKFLVVPLAVGALFFAGCGGDDSSDDNSSSDTATTQSQPADNSMGSGQVLNLAAEIHFESRTVEAPDRSDPTLRGADVFPELIQFAAERRSDP